MKGYGRRETLDERERSLETGDWRWETEDGRPEPGDGRRETGDLHLLKVRNSRHIIATSPDNDSFVLKNSLTLTM